MAELPSGAVTFLFTDVEGSTQLVKQLRGRYPEVLAEHQRILREAFAKHGGHEVDTQGDAFFVAFASARDAVLAAVDAQRALHDHEWPDAANVRVRIGIHTGQAAPVDGRYTGVAVHRAASGELTERSAVCPHLGCLVRWNPAEGSWDCPCHGSRFAPEGDLLSGPAARGLGPADPG